MEYDVLYLASYAVLQVGIVLMPIRIWIGDKMEIRIGINTMSIRNTASEAK
jgi:hypothetical protein